MMNENGSMLVVEDDPINPVLLSRCLHEEGYTTRTTEKGKQALDRLHREHFDLVLLDLLIPETDAGIISFKSEAVLNVSYGDDSTRACAKKRRIRRFNFS